MNRILLVRTDLQIPNWAISPPLGVMYLASTLRKNFSQNIRVEIFDMRLYPRAQDRLRKKIQDFQPEVVGLSTISFEAPTMHKVAKMAKEIAPSCRVIAGGPHATIFYDQILKDVNIDYAVVGEGEESFTELVKNLLGGEKYTPLLGVAGRMEGKVFFPGARPPITDLDALPFPAWDLIDIDAYLRFQDMNRSMGKGRYMPLFTSRACPYGCVYCHSIFGKIFRARSPENVLEEVELLRQKYAIEEFQIFDDCFNLDQKRAKQIGKMIAERVPGIRLSFPNGVRGDIIDREFLEIFRRAGAYEISFAIETVTSRLQKLIRKNLDLDKIKDAIYLADKLGYFVQGFFMIGFPTETEAEIRETIDYAVKSPLSAATFFTVIPFARTGLAQLASETGWGGEMNFVDCHYHSACTPYQTSTGLNLRKIQRQAYIRLYLRPGRIWKNISRVPNRPKYFIFFIWHAMVTIFQRDVYSKD